MAGYQRLVEIVETIFEDYTEFRYRTETGDKVEFKPLTLEYLPEGMEEIRREEMAKRVNLLYKDKNGKHIEIDQRVMDKNDRTTYTVDMEQISIDLSFVGRESVKFIDREKYGEERIQAIWLHDQYRVVIQSNLPKKEIVKIINGIGF